MLSSYKKSKCQKSEIHKSESNNKKIHKLEIQMSVISNNVRKSTSQKLTQYLSCTIIKQKWFSYMDPNFEFIVQIKSYRFKFWTKSLNNNHDIYQSYPQILLNLDHLFG